MNKPSARFNASVGQWLRKLRLRQQPSVQQEQVAAAARAHGLKWGRATVNAIEHGTRHLTIYELRALPAILAKVGHTTLNGMEIPVDGLLLEIEGQFADDHKAARKLSLLQTVIQEDAVQKTAPRYEISPATLARACLNAWGHGLTQERERRFKLQHGDVEPTPALRGHVTRACMAELFPKIAGMKRSRKRGR